MTRPGRVALGVGVLGIALAACAPSRGAVFGPVGHEVDRRIGVAPLWNDRAPDARVPAAVAALLARPLTLDAALRIAVANNRHLQAAYDELGIAAADIAEATTLAPTSVDVNRKYALDGGGDETELEAVQDVLDLIQLGQRRGIASAELRGAQARAIAATVALAAEVERAFYDVVAANQALELRQTAFDAASAAAEVIERMHAAGNTIDPRSRASAISARWPASSWRGRRPRSRPPRADRSAARADRRGHCLVGDRAAARRAGRGRCPRRSRAARGRRQLALAGAARRRRRCGRPRRVGARLRVASPELGVGVAVARRDGGEWEAGPALRIGLLLFNQQQGPWARPGPAHRARNELLATAVDLRATARAIRQEVLGAHAEARHWLDVVLPLRQRVLDETLLQYNAMNATTFELLMARRELVDAGAQYVEAVRRYWSAMAAATALRRGGPPSAHASTQEAP
ncbi:MAG: TolC family protein [Myxococcales bacterium]|nr:TolC family protein [Myxococcales bacterium]